MKIALASIGWRMYPWRKSASVPSIQYNYIEEVPLHESQQKVKESKDGMYREYTLTVRPSRDFLQELLWHGRNLIVLKPESLRQEMIGILKDMTKSYETGECLNGEE